MDSKVKELKALPMRDMASLAEFSRSDWFIKARPGITVSHLLHPSFWAHVVAKLKINDRIEVVADDGSFDVELRVIDKDVGFAKMRVLRLGPLSDQYVQGWIEDHTPAEPKKAKASTDKPKEFPCHDYKAATKWRVLGFDGNTVKQNIETEDEAIRELEEYKRRAQANAA